MLDVTLEAALALTALDDGTLDVAALVVAAADDGALVVAAADDGALEDGAALAAVVVAVPVAVLPQAARRPRKELVATKDRHMRRDRRTVGMDSSLTAVAPGNRWLVGTAYARWAGCHDDRSRLCLLTHPPVS
jgi:hypothetical protein